MPRRSRPESPRSGLGIWEAGNPGICKSGIQKYQKQTTVIRMKIRSAQNIHNVLISRKKDVPASFGTVFDQCFHGPNIVFFSICLGFIVFSSYVFLFCTLLLYIFDQLRNIMNIQCNLSHLLNFLISLFESYFCQLMFGIF